MGSFHSSPNEIVPRVWMGNADAADNQKDLIARGVRVVIDLSGEKYRRSKKIHYHRIKIEDKSRSNIRRLFEETNAIIDGVISSGQGSVFVHCLEGRSRSGAIILAYVMWSRKMSVDQALAHVRQARPSANPNSGFIKQLRAYELELKAV